MKQRWLLFALPVLVCSPKLEAAQARFYFCEVGYTAEAKNGRLNETTKIWFGVKSIGERFSINTQTGEMVGQVLKSQHWFQTHVIDNGSSNRGSRLKVLYSSPLGGEFVNLAYLQVDVRDDQQPSQRTFIFVDEQYVLSGVCSDG